MHARTGSPNISTFEQSYSRLRGVLASQGPLDRAAFTLQQDFLAVQDQKRYFQNRLDQEQKNSVNEKQALLRRVGQKNEMIILLEERVQRLEKQLRLKISEIQALLEEKSRLIVESQEKFNKLKIKHEYELQQLKDDLELRHKFQMEELTSTMKQRHNEIVQDLQEQLANMKKRYADSEDQINELNKRYIELAEKKDMEMREVLNRELHSRMLAEQDRFEHDSALRESILSQNQQLKSQIATLNTTLTSLHQSNHQLQRQKEELQNWKMKIQHSVQNSERHGRQDQPLKTQPILASKGQIKSKEKVEEQPSSKESEGKERVVILPSMNQRKMLEAVCGIVHMSRKVVAQLWSKIFARSIGDNPKKENSLSVFTTIVKRMLEYETMAVIQLGFIYNKLKGIMLAYAPEEAAAFLTKPRPLSGYMRDEVNEFAAKSMKKIQKQAINEKNEQNKYINSLYRLLELQSRLANPKVRGGYDIDMDMRITLEDGIVESGNQALQR